MPDHLPGAQFALLLRPCYLSRQHLQHGLNGNAAHHVNQFLDGQMRLLDLSTKQ
ncbi:MAG: hypothetical protein ABSG08_09715 [Terriglobales bacterium]|jgi:hypothetical protein